MTKSSKQKKRQKARIRNWITAIVILLILVGVPYAILHYQASKSSMTIGEVIQRKMVKSEGSESGSEGSSSTISEGEKIDFLTRRHIGNEYSKKPMISHVVVEDLDEDGLLDVLVCDALDNFVSWIRQYPENVYSETVLATDLIAPAHLQVKDFDGDGDKDVLSASAWDDKIAWYKNDGSGNFGEQHVITDNLQSAQSVYAADLDGDGDQDALFADRMRRNRGNGEFEDVFGTLPLPAAPANGA